MNCSALEAHMPGCLIGTVYRLVLQQTETMCIPLTIAPKVIKPTKQYSGSICSICFTLCFMSYGQWPTCGVLLRLTCSTVDAVWACMKLLLPAQQ